MQTNNIKTFAKKARLILLEGVAQRLKYWGFDDQGVCSLTVEPTAGGYTLRGQVFTDPEVPAKWSKLKKRLINKQAVEDVIEQAAYTWFNRLMAIKILESNGHITAQLAYSPGTRTPQMVQDAKRGNHPLKRKAFIDLLNEYLRESREEQAFGLLVTRLCNNNPTLHDVFGRIDDYTELLLPQNLLQKDGLMDLINSDLISADDYKHVELIGWLYQFYIADKKDKVFADFKKKKKARAEDIPAATQIFTPKWIVSYMVENTVGKLYLDYEPTSTLKQQMKYLVENEADKDAKPIISDIKELTLLDPASGSGHILVTGFDLLFKMYQEEGYTSRQAVENILKYSLWGLDIDDRAMQLARFAVLLKAAQYDADILNKSVIPHIYSFPEAEDFTSEDINLFLGAEGYKHAYQLITALNLLKQGKNIGSALKLDLSQEARAFINGQFDSWIQDEKNGALDIEKMGLWQRIKSFLEVMLVLTAKYTAVVANPPYMGSRNMNDSLKSYLSEKYPESKADLLTVFIEASRCFCFQNGRFGLITLHVWMFTSTYERFREILISQCEIESLVHVGRGLFGSDSGTVVFCLKNEKFRGGRRLFRKLFLNEVNVDSIEKKLERFKNPKFGSFLFNQNNLFKIPGYSIAYWLGEKMLAMFDLPKAGKKVDVRQGMATTENQKFLRFWFEVDILNIGFSLDRVSALISNHKWFPYNKGGDFRKWYGNHNYIVDWSDDGAEIKSNVRRKYPYLKGNTSFVLKESNPYFQESVSWTDLSWSVSARFYPKGFLFDVSGHSTFFNNPKDQFGTLAYLNTNFTNSIVKVINSTFHFQIGDFKKIPYPVKFIEEVKTNAVLDCVRISKKDWDSRETSWDFQQSPLLNDSQSLKQSYSKWSQDVTNDFFSLHANEEELNRIFIDIYGLQDELTPEVQLKDITILQDELDAKSLEQLEPTFRNYGKESIELPIKKEEVMAQFVSYCVGVMLGRYRLDKPGLNIAHPNPTDEELSSYSHNGQVIHIDQDAILPIMGNECSFADDVLQQVTQLLQAIWGEHTLTENINFMQECLGANLNDWITQKFWPFHTRMYKNKPIYWMFCSNPSQPHKSAFRVLAYMHRMDRFTVQRIQRNYLHPHQEYIRRETDKLMEHQGSLGRLEVKRLEMLQAWESECREYNEVLKELANQQIEFDLDDGVTVNYEKFEGAVAKF